MKTPPCTQANIEQQHAHMLAKGVFRLNKKHFLFPIIGLLSIGLAGCGNDESAVQDRNTERAQPFGYYSNENHHNGGNVQILDDNDGPITEMMDHTLGTEGTNDRNDRRQILDVKDENGNPGNPTQPLAENDRNFFERDNRFSRSDANYHGQLDGNQAGVTGTKRNQTRIQGTNDRTSNRDEVRTQNNRVKDGNQTRIQSTNPTVNDVNLSTKLNKTVLSVANVDQVQSIVHNNNVVIAVDLDNDGDKLKTKQRIQQAVKTYTKGKKVTIVTDQGSFTRVRNMNTNGGYRDEYDQDLRNIIQSDNIQAR